MYIYIYPFIYNVLRMIMTIIHWQGDLISYIMEKNGGNPWKHHPFLIWNCQNQSPRTFWRHLSFLPQLSLSLETVLVNVLWYTPRKLTWQWKIHHLKMYFLLKMGISNVMLVCRGVPSLKLTFLPMQIDGWKINFPFGMACFQGRTLFCGEVNRRSNSGLFSWEL